jgi:hypothetical protein
MRWCGNWFVSQQIADMARVKADFVTTIVTKINIIANVEIEYQCELATQDERIENRKSCTSCSLSRHYNLNTQQLQSSAVK